MTSITLEFESIFIQIHSPSEDLLDLLRQDFFHIIKESSEVKPNSIFAKIEIYLDQPEVSSPKGIRGFSFKEGIAYGWGYTRQIHYVDGSVLVFRHGSPHFAKLQSSVLLRARELSGLLVHSLLGEALERLGWSRVHGIGFQTGPGEIHLFPAKSGAGKSTLALRILQDTHWLLLSDEILWVKKNRVRGFPIHIAISDTHLNMDHYPNLKVLKPKERMRFGRKSVFELPIARVLKSSSFARFTFLKQNSSFPRWSWVYSTIKGDGLPQMVEVFLRGPNLPFLIKMSFQRFYFALRILFSGRLKIKESQGFLSDAVFDSPFQKQGSTPET